MQNRKSWLPNGVEDLRTANKPLKSWDTRVPISKSQEDIRNLLARFGATKIAFEEHLQDGTQILRFEYPMKEKMSVPVQFKIEVKGIFDWLEENGRTSWNNEYLWKQSKKVAWRHIFDWTKANINLVEFGLIPFENMFLSYFSHVLPDGSYRSLGEFILPKLHSGELFRKLLLQGEDK